MRLLIKSLVVSYSRCTYYTNLFKNIKYGQSRFLASLQNQFKYYNISNSNELSASSLMSQHKENTFSHQILEENKFNVVCFNKIKDELFSVENTDINKILEQNLNEMSASELCKAFKVLSVDAATKSLNPISHVKYDAFCQVLKSKVNLLSDEDLGNVLLYLSLWPMCDSSRAHNFNELWRELDTACIQRMRPWSFDKVLYFIDLWYLLKLTRISDFVFRSINVMSKKINQLSSHQIVQVLFYLNTIRKAHKGITMYNIEHKLESQKDNLSLEELGVALLGFFKTSTSLKSEDFLKYIIDRTIREIDTIKDITLASILKCLRLSMQIKVWRELPVLLDTITPHLDRFSLQVLTHVALLTAPSQTFHPPSLDIVSNRLVNEIQRSRLKDMEKVLFPLSRLNYVPPNVDIYSMVVQELSKPSRQEEIEAFPRCFIALLHCLALRSIFPHHLINKALDINFIHHTYGTKKYHFGRELSFIDTCLELEEKDYSGNRLPYDIRAYLYKRYSHYAPNENYKISKHATLALDVLSACQSLLGRQSAKFLYTVPSHPRPDIVVQAGGLGDKILNTPDLESPVYASPGDDTTVLVVVSKNMICPNQHLKLNGESMSKLKSISLLGHTPKLVLFNEWPIHGKLVEKEHCLEKILASESKLPV